MMFGGVKQAGSCMEYGVGVIVGLSLGMTKACIRRRIKQMTYLFAVMLRRENAVLRFVRNVTFRI